MPHPMKSQFAPISRPYAPAASSWWTEPHDRDAFDARARAEASRIHNGRGAEWVSGSEIMYHGVAKDTASMLRRVRARR